MGTRGYRVYRHKARFFAHYNHYDSYPDKYGTQVLSEIPRGVEFEKWLMRMRRQLDEELEAWEKEECPRGERKDDFITAVRPKISLHIEWIYELDLDELGFYVNSRPYFRLDHLPPHDIFLQSIASGNTPQEYRYTRSLQPLLSADDIVVGAHGLAGVGSVVPIHDLLAVGEEPSRAESVWATFLGAVMRYLLSGLYDIRVPENTEDELAAQDVALTFAVLNVALSTSFFAEGKGSLPPVLLEGEFWWAQRDICILTATDLDDGHKVEMSISKLRAAAMAKAGTPDVVYGVLASVFYIVIVRVDKTSGGTVKRTPVFHFFPLHSSAPPTQGISALVRLRKHVFTPPSLPLDHPLSGVTDAALGVLAGISPDFTHVADRASAAEIFLKYPILGPYPLLGLTHGADGDPGFSTIAGDSLVVVQLLSEFSPRPVTIEVECFPPLHLVINVHGS
ncbi:hypothetical protein BOTBODRAFT_185198 [Botryobasidium botryosum FD-172 SS1]|uniref:Uncharacterized protein n=1 Tax=Botryobasidium botryosum (strain FD-172 SS1) TaxID=930990 RepID=A0A067MVE3_BOTB1|nr:hypothetical protein BOTBODRAFT_185198 [Botryobasidium botryosum FD-172 SS1]